MSREVPFARAALHWEVIAVLASGEGLLGVDGFAARCRHRHASYEEAVACPWTPDPWPEVCDLLVRQVRSEPRAEQARMPWGDMATQPKEEQ